LPIQEESTLDALPKSEPQEIWAKPTEENPTEMNIYGTLEYNKDFNSFEASLDA